MSKKKQSILRNFQRITAILLIVALFFHAFLGSIAEASSPPIL